MWLVEKPPKNKPKHKTTRGTYLCYDLRRLGRRVRHQGDGRCSPVRVACAARPPSLLEFVPFWSYHLLRSCKKRSTGVIRAGVNKSRKRWAFWGNRDFNIDRKQLEPEPWFLVTRSGEVRPS